MVLYNYSTYMSALFEHLDRLFTWLSRIGIRFPTQTVRIVEINSDTARVGPAPGKDEASTLLVLLDFRSRALHEKRPDQLRAIDQVIGDLGREANKRSCFRVSREQLQRPEHYETRFDELLKEGFSWINLSCYGVYDNCVVVAVEVPYREDGALHPGCVTSVNLSGPRADVVSEGWRVDRVLLVE